MKKKLSHSEAKAILAFVTMAVAAIVFATMAFVITTGCSKMHPSETDGRIPFSVVLDAGLPLTKSENPDEELIHDVNLYVYGENGLLEEHRYEVFAGASGAVATDTGAIDAGPTGAGAAAGTARVDSVMLIGGREWAIYAIANVGRRLDDMKMSEMQSYKLYIPYPDGFAHGIPMAGRLDGVLPSDGKARLRLERLLSKVSVSIDRSRLQQGVQWSVSMLKVGNCPRCAVPFGQSRITSAADVFPSGFAKSGAQVSGLNSTKDSYRSDEVAVFLMENIPRDESDTLRNPYLELRVDYVSPTQKTRGEGLVYRFHIREGSDWRILRNAHYHIVIKPIGDGLQVQDEWRLDKDNLLESSATSCVRMMSAPFAALAASAATDCSAQLSGRSPSGT